MKDKKGEKCLNVFDDYRCQRPKEHRGKHWDDSGNYFVTWTQKDKERTLREREQEKASTAPV